MKQEDAGDVMNDNDETAGTQKPEPEPVYLELFHKFIDQCDLEDDMNRAQLYSGYRLRRHGSIAKQYLNNAEDYAYDAFKRTLEGERPFPFEAGKTLLSHLCSVIDSLVWHDLEKAKRRGTQVREARGNNESDDDNIDRYVEEHLASGDDFERGIIARNEVRHFADSLEPELRALVLYRAEDTEASAEDCAQALNVSVRDIYNLDKRLKRRLSDAGNRKFDK